MKRAMVTGASRGIGEAVAGKLAAEGYDLCLVCRNSLEKLKKLGDALAQEFGIRCEVFECDLADPVQTEVMIRKAGQIDVLVHNAGISYIGLLSEMSLEDWNRVINTNLNSCFYLSHGIIPQMVHRKEGKMVFISSVWGNTGASMEVAYSASKGGVNSFTKALAKELAPSNIQVNAVAFGVIDTDMNRCFSQEEMEALREEIPADRIGTCEEAAEMILQVIQSPAYLTGQVITMDGGWI